MQRNWNDFIIDGNHDSIIIFRKNQVFGRYVYENTDQY